MDGFRCKLQLHISSDVSEAGHGASTYLRVEELSGGGFIHSSFVKGKARNAPVKFVSIPRPELQVAMLSRRVNNMLIEEMD